MARDAFGIPEKLDDTQRELSLFIENDEQLFNQQHLPIQRNLLLKKIRGTYDRAKARKAFKSLADSGAQKYNKEFGNPSLGSSFGPFTAEDRRAVAVAMENEFFKDVEDGSITAEEIGLKIPKTVQKMLQEKAVKGKSSSHLTQRSLDRTR